MVIMLHREIKTGSLNVELKEGAFANKFSHTSVLNLSSSLEQSTILSWTVTEHYFGGLVHDI